MAENVWKQRVSQLQNEKQCLQHLIAKKQFEIDRMKLNNAGINRQKNNTFDGIDSALVVETEERIKVLEDQLLSAEEMIIHLKAEKLQLQRHKDEKIMTPSVSPVVPLLNSTLHHEEEEIIISDNAVADLTRQIHSDQLQNEEKMAVIVEQEREIAILKDELRKKEDVIGRLQKKNHALVEEVERLDKLNQLLIEEDEEEEEEKAPIVLTNPTITTTGAAEWQEDTTRHPTPPFDITSPEITYLLQQWSQNSKKLQYLKLWMQKVLSGQIFSLLTEFPNGLELPKLRPEIRDGFLTLVVPLLRRQTDIHVIVHIRQHDPNSCDLRFRVEPI